MWGKNSNLKKAHCVSSKEHINMNTMKCLYQVDSLLDKHQFTTDE